MQGAINSPTYFKLKAMQIIGNDLNNISKDDFDRISLEIEDSLKPTE